MFTVHFIHAFSCRSELRSPQGKRRIKYCDVVICRLNVSRLDQNHSGPLEPHLHCPIT